VRRCSLYANVGDALQKAAHRRAGAKKKKYQHLVSTSTTHRGGVEPAKEPRPTTPHPTPARGVARLDASTWQRMTLRWRGATACWRERRSAQKKQNRIKRRHAHGMVGTRRRKQADRLWARPAKVKNNALLTAYLLATSLVETCVNRDISGEDENDSQEEQRGLPTTCVFSNLRQHAFFSLRLPSQAHLLRAPRCRWRRLGGAASSAREL